MTVRDIAYEAEGRQMVGRLAFDDTNTERRAGVLLCHEGPGLDDHVKGRAERLAELGYCAFALDYHGGGRILPRQAVIDRVSSLLDEPEQLRSLGRAGLDVLLGQEITDPARVAVLGYCAGGTMALELARDGADLRAVVGFHCGLGTSRPDDARNITGSVLVFMGADDPLVAREERVGFEDEMRNGGVGDWQLQVYGGVGHSFTNPQADVFGVPGVANHEPSDTRSWRSTLALLDETLGRPGGG